MKIVKESLFDVGSHVSVKACVGELVGATVSDVKYNYNYHQFEYKLANEDDRVVYPEYTLKKYN